MCGKNFLRRTVPFFATFLIGVFIASFFVSIGRPGYGGRRAMHFEEDRQIRVENDRLRDENTRLQEQLKSRPFNYDSDFSERDIRELVPPPNPLRRLIPHSVR